MVKTAKKISENFFLILPVVIAVLVIVFISDFLLTTVSSLEFGLLYSLALNFARTGVILAFIALLFFPLRKAGIHLRGKNNLVSSTFYKNLSSGTALLHPVIGLLSFFFLSIHGFIFLKIMYNFEFTIINVFGAVSLSFFLILLVSGSILKKNMSRKGLRIFHLIISVCFIAFFVLHRSFM